MFVHELLAGPGLAGLSWGTPSFPTKVQWVCKETEIQSASKKFPGGKWEGKLGREDTQSWVPVLFLIPHSGKRKTSGLTLEPLTHNLVANFPKW
jgi:hypothetical protein